MCTHAWEVSRGTRLTECPSHPFRSRCRAVLCATPFLLPRLGSVAIPSLHRILAPSFISPHLVVTTIPSPRTFVRASFTPKGSSAISVPTSPLSPIRTGPAAVQAAVVASTPPSRAAAVPRLLSRPTASIAVAVSIPNIPVTPSSASATLAAVMDIA